jgi:hypothetical protein
MKLPSMVTGRKVVIIFVLVGSLLAVAWTPGLESPPHILITQLHIFLSRAGDRVQVAEYYLISNAGDQTYEGAQDPETGKLVTLTFSLPDGAEALRFDGPGLGERFVKVEGGFADTEPVPPGTATVEVLFSYELPYREGLPVEHAFDVPVTSVVLVLSEKEMALKGAGVTPAGTLDTQMGPAFSYTAGPLAAGEPLAFALVTGSQPVPVAPTSFGPARNPASEAAIGLVALAGALAVAYLLWRSPVPGPLPVRVRPLVEEIAALDADFETGQVSEKAYRKKRKSLKLQICGRLE